MFSCTRNDTYGFISCTRNDTRVSKTVHETRHKTIHSILHDFDTFICILIHKSIHQMSGNLSGKSITELYRHLPKDQHTLPVSQSIIFSVCEWDMPAVMPLRW
jgi:hypothetical protein